MVASDVPHRRARIRSVALEVVFLALYLIVAVAVTWPLALDLDHLVSDPGDPYLNAFILDWGAWATLHQPFDLFDAQIFHPASRSLAFSENLYGIALPLVPAWLLGASPISLYGLATLAGFALNGYAAFVLARLVTSSQLAALAGGLFYALVPYRFDHLAHVQIVFSAGLPLLLSALLFFARGPSWQRGLLLTLAYVFNGLTNIHWLLFGSVATAITIVILGWTRPDRVRFWIGCAASLLVGGLLLAPFLLPYWKVSKEYEMVRSAEENRFYSATLRDWFVSTGQNHLYGDLLVAHEGQAERHLFPGLMVILLAALGLRAGGPGTGRLSFGRAVIDLGIGTSLFLCYMSWADEGVRYGHLTVTTYAKPAMIACVLVLLRWSLRDPEPAGVFVAPDPGIRGAMIWTVVGVLGSFGLNGFFHRYLFENVVAFSGIRVPARWAMVAYAGLAVLAALGMRSVIGDGRRWRVGLAALVLVLFGFELYPGPIHWYVSTDEVPEAHRWIGQVQPEGAVVEMPLTGGEPSEALYVLWQHAHRRPLVNGVSGFETPLHRKLAELATSSPVPDEFLDRLETIGTSIVIVHADLLQGTQDPRMVWLRENFERGRLLFVGRFEHGVRGDYVFATRRAADHVAQWRQAARVDRSGLTAQDKLRVLLGSSGPTYNEGPFGVIDLPRQNEDARDSLHVSGWALAEAGIQSVTVKFQSGQVVLPATLVPRGDVTALYPWYGAQNAGFDLVVPGRPHGVRLHTDLVVELVDGKGRVRRLGPVVFTWRSRPPLRLRTLDPLRTERLFERLGVTDAAVRAKVVAQPEALREVAYTLESRGASRDEFVEIVYRTLLDRHPKRNERIRALESLRRGANGKDVIDEVMGTPEFGRLWGGTSQ